MRDCVKIDCLRGFYLCGLCMALGVQVQNFFPTFAFRILVFRLFIFLLPNSHFFIGQIDEPFSFKCLNKMVLFLIESRLVQLSIIRIAPHPQRPTSVYTLPLRGTANRADNGVMGAV